MKKRSTLAGLLVSVFLIPVLVSAATVDDIRAQIDAILKQITALQVQLDMQSTGQVTVTTPPSTTNTCPNLYRTIYRGLRGNDVLSLQQFLITQGLLDDESASGYFGLLTEGAVQKWQIQNGVVAGGTSNTTGYGVVGALTRAAMLKACNGGQGISPISPIQPPVCPMIIPPQCENGILVSLGHDTRGCSLGYQCAPKIAECPAYSVPPPCENGKLISKGKDANDCSIGYECRLNTTIMCPQIVPPPCPNGTLISLGTDASGCSLGYQCKQPTTECPAIAIPAVYCPGGWKPTSYDAKNCPLGYTCATSTAPSISLAAPIEKSDGYNLSWTARNIPTGATMSLSLVPKVGGEWADIIKNRPLANGTESYFWKIPDFFCHLDACGIAMKTGTFLFRAFVLSNGTSITTGDSPQFLLTLEDPFVPSVTVTINGNEKINSTQGDPIIYGTASAVAAIRLVVISKQTGATVHDSGLFNVAAGQWSKRITPALPGYGYYLLNVYDKEGNIILVKELNILTL